MMVPTLVRMMAHMMVQTIQMDEGTRQACRWRCAASVNSDLGMRTETVNSAMKFDLEFQRKQKQQPFMYITYCQIGQIPQKLTLKTTAVDLIKVSSHFDRFSYPPVPV